MFIEHLQSWADMTTKYCWSCYSSHKQTKITFSGQIMETGRVLLLMKTQMQDLWASQMALEVKNKKTKQNKTHLPMQEKVRDADLIPGLGTSPGGGHSNPLQCSCLENPIGRGAWQTKVHRVAKSRTRLK